MARINNKFATQNLNDIYGKKEPKPQAAADSANAAGGRNRGGYTHGGGGMLVLRPPVKQPPIPLKDLKTTTTTSISALKKDAPLPPPPLLPQTPPVSSTNPQSSFNNNDSNNKAELSADSNPAPLPTTTSITAEVAAPEIPKSEPSDAISLRPNQNRRPEIYTPPAARTLTQIALEQTTEILPTLQTLTPAASNPVLNEPVREKALETVKDEPPAPAPTPADVVKPSRPEPFRPPQLRGDAARRIEPSTVPMPPREDSNSNSNPARGWDRDNYRGSNSQQRSRRDEEGRYSRDASQQHQHQRRYDRDQRGGGGGGYYNREGNSHSSYYSRSAPEARNYDIEVIRPGSGGSDRYNSVNSRDYSYGGRQGFDRQKMSPPSYPYWGEGQGQGQGQAQANYESYEHRQDFNRRSYNSNNFKSGGMNHRDFQNRDSGYSIGRDGGQQRRDQPYGRSGQGQFRDNFAGQAHSNGRFSVSPREQHDGGNFRQYSRMQRDTYSGGGYRYNDPTRFVGDGYQRPRSGGYEGVSPRPRSSGYGGNAGASAGAGAGAGRLVGSSDSMVSRPNFYNGRRSPISQDKVGYKDFGPQGRYQYDGPMSKMNEMQSVDAGFQRPRSGGYGGHATGRSIASSDNMMSRPNNINGPRLPISREKMDSEDFSRGIQDQYHLENFSRGTQDQYHLEGSFSTTCEVQGLNFVSNTEVDNSIDPFNEFDSYRTRREIQKAEPNVDKEHQIMGWDSSMEYNRLNLESLEKGGGNEDMVVKADHRLDVEQKFYVEDKRHYYTEEENSIEDARKETVKQDQLAKGISLPKKDGGLEQEMREEIAEVAINREPILESVDPHTEIYETSGQLKEEDNPPDIDFGSQEQDNLADRFASSRITAGRNPRPIQLDSTPNMRGPNYHSGRDVGPQPNPYTSRSSAMSWRREPNETKNGSPQRFSSHYGDYNYKPQSRESSSSERYQFRHG